MKNNATFKEYVAPILVLVCICLVVTAALAATYGVTKPIIETNSKKAADDIFARFKNGEKLSTEDLMALQKSGYL